MKFGIEEIFCCRCGKIIEESPKQMCSDNSKIYFCCEKCHNEWNTLFSPALQKKVFENGWKHFYEVWDEIFSGFKRFESKKMFFVFR